MESRPFPHLILDGVLDPELVEQVAASLPPGDWPHWVRYDGAQERKRTCRDIHRLSNETCRLFHYFNSMEWIHRLQEFTGIQELMPDPTFHGGGVHCSEREGFLDIHIDYARHPLLDLERRLNLVLFLNRDWRQEWNGALEFWDSNATQCIKKIWPKFNRLVLWEPCDVAYHGHPHPLACPKEITRDTIAVYYLCRPRSANVVRTRALFVPRR